MEYTKNYNLKKPSEEDFYNVNDFNSNSEIVDTELKKLDQIIKTLQDGINAAELLKKIKEVDGPGSGLDADTVDGLNTGYSPTNSYIPIVNDSILEIGRTIDFHIQNSTQDFDARMFIDANFLPAWHIPNQTVIRIPVSNHEIQYALNADMLDGKHADFFARSSFGGAGETSRIVTDILNIKNENGNYVNGKFMGANLANAPNSNWHIIEQIVHNDAWVIVRALEFTDPNAKWIENRRIQSVWQGWKEVGGGNNLFTILRPFSVKQPVAGQTLFSYSGGSGELKTITVVTGMSTFGYTIILDGQSITFDNSNYNTNIYMPYSGNYGWKEAASFDLKFKNSISIVNNSTLESTNYIKGLVVTEK